MANYHGKYLKPSRFRPFLWVGIVCGILALVCTLFVGKFLIGAIKEQNTRRQAIQTYVNPIASIPEKSAPEDIRNEEIIIPTDATESTDVTETAEATETTENTTVPTEPPRFPTIDFAGLQLVNEDVVAWLQIPALEVINYPVTLGEDNAYYTTHTWDKEESENGAIFLDFRNQRDFSQIHNILYGHCMKDGSMFQSLGEWEKDSFYNDGNRTVLLYLPDETRVYEIFAVERVNALDSRVFKTDYIADETWKQALEETLHKSQQDTDRVLTDQSEVLTLSTCIGGTTRLVIHAVCIEHVPV